MRRIYDKVWTKLAGNRFWSETLIAPTAKSLRLDCIRPPIFGARMDPLLPSPIVDPDETTIRRVLNWVKSVSEYRSERMIRRPAPVVA